MNIMAIAVGMRDLYAGHSACGEKCDYPALVGLREVRECGRDKRLTCLLNWFYQAAIDVGAAVALNNKMLL